MGLALLIVSGVVFLSLNLIPPTKPSDQITPTNNKDISNLPDLYLPPFSKTALKTIYMFPTYKNGESNQPEEDKIDKVIRLFNSYVDKTFQISEIPGAAVLVVYKGQPIYMKPLGVKEIGTPYPVDSNSLFQIGSLSKAFTSAAMASLVDDGTISWDDKVSKYYNSGEFALYDSYANQEVNMRDLLSHRSGLPSDSGADLIFLCKYNFSETIYKLRYMKNDTLFRSTFEYNNILYALAGGSASRAAGESWAYIVRNNIFKPLKMDSSGANLNDFLSALNKVSNHITVNKTVICVSPTPETDIIGPAGSISSSIHDLANWLIFQLDDGKFNGQQIISSQSIAETHTPHCKKTS